MDRIAERLSEWFGSTPFIALHVIWFAVWLILGLPKELLTLIVSLEAIFLAIFVLRAENVQSERLEKYVKEATRASKKDLELTNAILKEVKEQRFQR